MISDFFGKRANNGPAKKKREALIYQVGELVSFWCDKEEKPLCGVITRINKSYCRVRVSRNNRQWVTRMRLVHSRVVPLAANEPTTGVMDSDSEPEAESDQDCPSESEAQPAPPELGTVEFARLVETLEQENKVPAHRKKLVNDLKDMCTPATASQCMAMLCGPVPRKRVKACLRLIEARDKESAPTPEPEPAPATDAAAPEEEEEEPYVAPTNLLDSDVEDEEEPNRWRHATQEQRSQAFQQAILTGFGRQATDAGDSASSMACSGDEGEESEGSARATPQPPAKKNGKAKAKKDESWGCSRCRWRITGCTAKRCNPKPGAREAKAARKAEKEAAKLRKKSGVTKKAKKSKPAPEPEPEPESESEPEPESEPESEQANNLSTLLDSDDDQEQQEEEEVATVPMEEEEEEAEVGDEAVTDEEWEAVRAKFAEMEEALHKETQKQRKVCIDALRNNRCFFYEAKRDNAFFKIMKRDDSILPLGPGVVGHDEICAWLATQPTTTTGPIGKVTAHLLFVVLTAEPTQPWKDLAGFLEYAETTSQKEFSEHVATHVFLCKLPKMSDEDKKRVLGLMEAFHLAAKALSC